MRSSGSHAFLTPHTPLNQSVLHSTDNCYILTAGANYAHQLGILSKPWSNLWGFSNGDGVHMGVAQGMMICLAYIVGLLSTGAWWGGWLILSLGIVAAIAIPRCWRTAPRSPIWLLAGVIGLLASVYFQIRLPQPTPTDISRLITDNTGLTLTVKGKVDSLPHLTRSQKSQFWLNVTQAEATRETNSSVDLSQPVEGRLYVTAPLAQAADLHPGQRVEVSGTLYKPKPATNPGGFDFQKYLQQEDCFAGLSGKRIEVPQQSTGWGWWMVQQRIVRSQARWLDRAAGALVTSMVLGSRGVDLPFSLKDQFTQVGLAHALAASGFQTSLILGVVLALCRRFPVRVQVVVGMFSLLLFVALTGIQPAVLRAALMGLGGLVALLLRRKLNPLGALLVAATLLLLYQPGWIWNLGFQLSFLATLGLVVTVPALTKRLDWLPSALVPLLAVPLAAYLWTLPLQLFAFGVLSPYTIPVNLVTTPLISLISLGGMVSALAALVWSPAGSALAWLLKYPTLGLIAVVNWFAQLPGNAYAVGTIAALSAIALYLLIGLTWLHPWWHKRWWLAGLVGISLIVIPTWQARANLFQVTLLATSTQPVMVVQDQNKATVFNSGDESTATLSLLPFLQKQGINEIHWAVATEAPTSSAWQKISARLPIHTIYSLTPQTEPTPVTNQSKHLSIPVQEPIQLGRLRIQHIHTMPPVLELQMSDQTWLWLGTGANQQELFSNIPLPRAQVLWWSGGEVPWEVLNRVQPQVAIASANRLNPQTPEQFRQQNIRLLWSKRDGAIQWTPTSGFQTALAGDERP